MHGDVCTCVCVCKYLHKKRAVPACPNENRSVVSAWGDIQKSFVCSILENLSLKMVVVTLGVCRWLCPSVEEAVPSSLPSLPAVHPCGPPWQISPPSPGLTWEVPFWGFSDLFQARWTQLNHFHCQSCWSSSLGLKYKSLHQQIQGTVAPGRGGGTRCWHSLFQTDSTRRFPQPSWIQVKMHGHGLITAAATFIPAFPFQTPCYSIVQQ